jgi:tetratricopeptide (TPR) repeat protein
VSLLPGRRLRVVLLASLVALGVGAQFRHAVAYREDWEQTVSLLDQLAWRLPQIPENTLLLAPGLPLRFSTDNSLTAALNWIYLTEPGSGLLPLLLLDTSLRFGGDTTDLLADRSYTRAYGTYTFSGSLDRALVILFQPLTCLCVLDPEVDIYRPQLGSDTRRLLAAAVSPLFPLEPAQRPRFWPAGLLGEPRDLDWCAVFNRADLARQEGDWAAIRGLYELAAAENETPNHAAERLPIIEGYANLGEWERALALTREALKINRDTGSMLCAAWVRIDRSTPDSQGKQEAFHALAGALNCP